MRLKIISKSSKKIRFTYNYSDNFFVLLQPQILWVEIIKIGIMNPKVQQAATSNVDIKELPKFKAGDTVTVHYKIKEGNKERVQPYQGVVIKRTGKGHTGTFTVRKISNGIGIERIFPIASPFLEKIEVNKVGVVRRSKIYYLRERTGKAARIREKRM